MQPLDTIKLCDSSKPFCNSLETPNQCSATPGPPNPICDEAHASDFTCTAAGVFPGNTNFRHLIYTQFKWYFSSDTSNCSQFYTCTAANGKSETFTCPTGQVYDSIVQACVTQRNRCTTVKCPKNKNVLLAYKTNTAFYVQCINSQQIIHRCTEGANTIFDEKRQQCIYDCKTAGNFPDREDCTQFYTCTKKGLKLISNVGICPPDSGFVDTKCVHTDTACESEISKNWSCH